MHLAQRAYVLIVLTGALAIAGIWSHDPALSRWWHLPAAVLLVGVAFEALRVRRSGIALQVDAPSRVYLGRPFQAIFRLHTDRLRPALVELAPVLPVGFESPGRPLRLLAQPGAGGRDDCVTLLPVTLGRQSWPTIPGRVLGSLGMAWWSLDLQPSSEVTVAPDTLRIARVTPRGNPAGTRPRRTVGAGSELHQLRDYVHGDPLARIDWKATARTRTLVSREFSEDQHLDVLVMLDAGRSSRVRTGRLDRLGVYANIAARFAEVVTPNDDRVGLLVFSDRPVSVCMPDRGLPAVVRVRRALERISPSGAESDVSAAAVRARRMLKHRGLIVLLSCFDDPAIVDQLTRAVRLLSPPHVVMIAGAENTDIKALASQPARDWRDPWISLAAQEHEARAAAHRFLLRRLGMPVVCVREEWLEQAVIAEYESLRRSRRI
jgi:uncharacterized protein (DUF58 family)